MTLHKAKKKAKEVAYWLTKQSLIRPEPGLIPMRWTFHPKTANAVDIDNLVASCKAAADGIAKAWGVDDSMFRPTYELGEVMKDGLVCVEVL
jgi:hypothetical protein